MLESITGITSGSDIKEDHPNFNVSLASSYITTERFSKQETSREKELLIIQHGLNRPGFLTQLDRSSRPQSV